MQEIYDAGDEARSRAGGRAAKVFQHGHGAKYPKAVAKITDALDVLLEFYPYTAEHRVHRTP